MRSEDIAKLAGVSRSTVSRVINNYSNVPEKTREKVMKIVEEYHYEPNTSARILAGKSTNTIGLFVISTTEKHNPNRIYQNNYFAPFVDALVDTANAMGYYVLIHTIYSEDDFIKVKQAFQQKRIDGGIIVGTENNMAMARVIADLEVPFVLIDYDIAELLENRLDRNNLAVINSKDYEGAAKAVEHLISLGHRDIAFISGRQNTYSGKQRYQAYMTTMQDHGLKVIEKHVLSGDFLRAKAEQEVKKMLLCDAATWPSAIFSANDEMALGAMDACKGLGVLIPEQLSLIGFDDIPVAAQLNPNLSSVSLPIYEMSQKAALILVEMCEKGSASFSTISFPTQLMIRETTRELNASL
ncbi:LacI family DNA-binding transcriptional regulator [Paenibacillus crassostreae]|uniref:Transcriptional regulator n=1 Tax=Paenibacillus crassostreae TaxID=1763538 RepID=A0A167GRY9_9BACL|nr:LacI family DNA-binding transcriptional regulator [Paenibacillus crassostreae]AOZ92037.1 LacI family transcriptional regulator [Paenibacillus crassostreae]OAB77846.1 transcriptional regulator [Paenibacillus crassostreae]